MAYIEVLQDELNFQTCWTLSDTIGPPMWIQTLNYVQRKPSMK